jgi:hypothetical protein
MFNFSKPQSFIGLDVSGSSIKLMQIKKDGKNFAVKAFSRGALPKGALINDVIADQKTFNFVLKQALDKPQFGRFDTQYAVAALPESKSFIRVIQIHKMTGSLVRAIFWAAMITLAGIYARNSLSYAEGKASIEMMTSTGNTVNERSFLQANLPGFTWMLQGLCYILLANGLYLGYKKQNEKTDTTS